MNDSSLISEVCTDEILNNVARKVQISQRITNEEAIYLYEHGSLGFLGSLANLIRERKHGDKTYFNRNFHIEPTNICVYSCSFCSYSRLIKKREEGWEYTDEQIMDIVRTYDNKEVTEVHIVGGVLPQYDLKFYTDLFKKDEVANKKYKAYSEIRTDGVFVESGENDNLIVQKLTKK